MTRALAALAALALTGICLAQDDEETEKKLTQAIHAADGMCILAEYDLMHLIRDKNRTFLESITENGGTIRVGHANVCEIGERIVDGVGELVGRYEDTAKLTRELGRLAAAQMAMVFGDDPINAD